VFFVCLCGLGVARRIWCRAVCRGEPARIVAVHFFTYVGSRETKWSSGGWFLLGGWFDW